MLVNRLGRGESPVCCKNDGEYSHSEEDFPMPAPFLAIPIPIALEGVGSKVRGSDQKLFNNATNVVLMRQGTRTVLSMQNNYQGPPENFAMVVPVPVILNSGT
jgi:hypothetical protein